MEDIGSLIKGAVDKAINTTPPIETPPVATPPVEAPPAAPAETPAGTPPVETPPAASVPPVEAPPVEVPEHLKKLTELSGGKFTFDSEDKVKEFFETHDKVTSEYETLKKKSDDIIDVEKYLDEFKLYDPLTLVGGEENYKRNIIAGELAKQGDREMAQRIVFADRKNIDDLTLMGMWVQYKDPDAKGDSKGAIETYLESINVNVDEVDEWNNPKELLEKLPPKKKGVIKLKAAELRETLDKLTGSVQIPEVKNPIKGLIDRVEQTKVKTNELKGKWKEAETPIKESLKKLEFQDIGFDFEIKEDVSQIVDDYLTAAASKGLEPDEANKQSVLKAIQEEIWRRDRKKIIAARDSFIEAKIKAEYDKKYENRQPLSTPNQVNVATSKSAVESDLRKKLGL